MKAKLLGKKRGMTHVFDKDGNIIACTVISAEPNVVTQIKTLEKDGYCAIQTASDEVKAKDPRTKELRVSKPLRGHYRKAGVEPRKHLTETRLEKLSEDVNVGDMLTVEEVGEGSYLDVRSVSKGKGFQGVMKLHNFRGGPAAHGSGFHRHAGSTGMRSTPGRCLPGGKRASQMGNRSVTIQNIQVVKVDKEKNLLLLKGSVPGSTGSLVCLSLAKKKPS